ncbi:hypothetical protein P8876_11275 [Bacillus haynesii]|uniref:hypothetical protein n=1 Tax=Bacillus haynesii TaxID=1925021 RepID=UPI002282782D|nr:hypothetical protein [Bacillus haynesii]MCY7752234.1 hypothetical protein [Bacillus haynesii]MCY8065864.1 hypothetical protein [Bacillus haynesii]MCY8557293.1 hypothetical protein [Bacillus haynesii]MEC0699946.1 hypothetical protein [Bacillus haynesii]
MVFVKVLLTTAFLTGAFAGFLWAFSKEKGDEFFSEMAADGSGIFTLFGLIDLLFAMCVSFIPAVILLMMSVFIWLIDF